MSEDEFGEFTERLTITLLIEDVTKATRDEFVRRLTEPGHEIELRLSDGLHYVAVVQDGSRG